MTGLWQRLRGERGQAVTEYAIVLVFIAAVAAAMVDTGLAATIAGKVGSAISKI